MLALSKVRVTHRGRCDKQCLMQLLQTFLVTYVPVKVRQHWWVESASRGWLPVTLLPWSIVVCLKFVVATLAPASPLELISTAVPYEYKSLSLWHSWSCKFYIERIADDLVGIDLGDKFLRSSYWTLVVLVVHNVSRIINCFIFNSHFECRGAIHCINISRCLLRVA